MGCDKLRPEASFGVLGRDMVWWIPLSTDEVKDVVAASEGVDDESPTASSSMKDSKSASA